MYLASCLTYCLNEAVAAAMVIATARKQQKKIWIFWAYCLLETISNRWFYYCWMLNWNFLWTNVKITPLTWRRRRRRRSKNDYFFLLCFDLLNILCLIGWIVAKFEHFNGKLICTLIYFQKKIINGISKWFSFFFSYISRNFQLTY